MKGRIRPGSETHFALIGAKWHLNYMQGEDYADLMAFAREVWDAALASADEARASGTAVCDLVQVEGSGKEEPTPLNPALVEIGARKAGAHIQSFIYGARFAEAALWARDRKPRATDKESND